LDRPGSRLREDLRELAVAEARAAFKDDGKRITVIGS
jgi:hypothetical protein